MLSAFVFLALSDSSLVPGLSDPARYKPNGPRISFKVAARGQFEITTDPKVSPETVKHIVRLVERGFYDRQRFHRVEPWVTQWGAPESVDEPLDVRDPISGALKPSEKVGSGGSGRAISVFEKGTNVDFYRGIVGLASTGFQIPGDSQLFILKRDAFRLYGSYAILGKVTKGMEIVDTIRRGDRIQSARIQKQKNPDR